MVHAGHQKRSAAHDDELSRFCRTLFASFGRCDQRRWGEVYVRGLAGTPGRKSLRRICEHVLGRGAEQSLQQFVNQSSWDWTPVRRQLAEQAMAHLAPRAWVVEEALIPKSGHSSVGVDRQFSQSAGRVVNCQLALTVLAAGAHGSTPVNWRLLLPRSWDEDDARRAQARLPEHERHRPRWEHLLDALTEMTHGWRVRPLPVIVDLRGSEPATPLADELDRRGLPYAIRTQSPLAHGGPGSPTAAPAGQPAIPDRTVRRRSARSCGPLPGMHAAPGARHVVLERRQHRRAPAAYWVTNLVPSRPSMLDDLIALRHTARRELDLLGAESGLRDFEGRSYRGWHHHTTLVSAAHAYQVFQRVAGAS
jgi:hypothetical protein